MKKRGVINYLDPVDKSLSRLVGEIYSGDDIYLFIFTPDTILKMGDEVEFELDANGVAISVQKI